jgi:hypothetical protein
VINTPAPATRNMCLVVEYDGSLPATRVLDAAVAFLHGRSGQIDVVYVAHLPSVDMLSAEAAAEMVSMLNWTVAPAASPPGRLLVTALPASPA